MFHINGSPETSNQFTVDGVNANLSLIADPSATIRFGDGLPLTAAGGVNSLITQGNVNEFGVSAWSYKANLALLSGRQVSISSKAGTNSFHGTLFEDFGNSRLNAHDWFANSRALKKPVSQINHYGGTFGGSIVRDKLFFYTGYEGLSLRRGSFALTDVPSLNARQNAPLSVQPLLNAFPLPNGAARNDNFAEFASTFTTPATANIANLRLDYQPDYKLHLTGRYHLANSYATTRGDDGFSLNTLKRTDNQIQTVTGKVIYEATPYVVFETSANYSRVRIGQAYSLDNFGGANVVSSDFANGFNLSKFDLYGRNAAIAASSKIEGTLEQFNLIGDGTVYIDPHTISFGADFRSLFLTTGSQPTERNVLFNGINGTLSGNTARVNFFNRTASQNPSIKSLSAYIHDHWRVTPEFTLQYGLIWATNKPVSNDAQTQLALANTNPPFTFASDGVPLWKATYNNFAPRVSAAYCFGDSCDNIIRAGFGLYYDNPNINAAEIFGHSFPFTNSTVAFNQPFNSSNQNQTANKTFIGYAPNLRLPMVRQWSVSFERPVTRSTTITATYQGSQGRRLLLTRTFINQDSAFPFARLTTNEAESDYNAFQLRFQKRFSKSLSFLLNYNLTKSLDNVSSDSLSRAVIATPEQDRGYSDFDARHFVNGYITYSLPEDFENKLVSHLFGNWSFTSFLSLRSAMPINVVYGRVNSFGVSYLRPDSVQNTGQLVSSSFPIPSTNRQGNLTRNSLRAFPFYQVDLGASRKIKITEDVNLILRLGVVNLFNHTNFAAPSFFDLSLGTFFPNGNFLPNSTFGQASSLATTANEREISPRLFSSHQPNASRSLQFSVKFVF